MLLSTSETFTRFNVALESGAELLELTLAYETFGTLNEDGSNAMLLCHGYTSHPHAGDEGGWFSNLMGPGKAVDTDNTFVVCSNMLGSAFGSTGPASIDPSIGVPYGPDFPRYTTKDMIAAQHALIDHLGINQLKAVIGYSYGGHLTYLWGATYPERMRALVPIAGVIERRTTAADVDALRARLAECPGWNDGHYFDNERDSGVFAKLVEIRTETLNNYGIGKHLEDTVGDPRERARMIQAQAMDWAGHFDANALIKLSEAGIGSTADAAAIRAPLLNVLCNTDSVVPVSLGAPTVELLKSHGVDATFLELDSPYGHAAPTIDAALWADDLKVFLDRT